MEINLIAEAFKFMVLGMGIVFIFLVILIQVIKWQAVIIGKYFPDKLPVKSSPTSTVSSDDEQARVAAVIAAVTEFRKNK